MEAYWAKDAKLGRDVAIEVLSDEFAGTPGYLLRLEKEAKSLA